MAQPYVRKLTAVAISPACPLDHLVAPFSVGVGVVIATGPATYSVEITYDDPANASDNLGTGLTWFAVTGLTALTASNGNTPINLPCRAVRLNVSALTAGSVTMTAIQAGGAPR